MLSGTNVQPMLPVDDLEKATRFYDQVLGLRRVNEEPGMAVTYRSGRTTLNVYKSEFAGTNKATALTFEVDDIDSEVSELKEKGIFFEKYDVEGLTQKGDIFEGEGGFKTAWFKDPDGNILSLVEGE